MSVVFNVPAAVCTTVNGYIRNIYPARIDDPICRLLHAVPSAAWRPSPRLELMYCMCQLRARLPPVHIYNHFDFSSSSQSAGNQFKGPSASLAVRGVTPRAPARTGGAGVHVQVCVVSQSFQDSKFLFTLSWAYILHFTFNPDSLPIILCWLFDRWRLSLALKRRSIPNILVRWSNHVKEATLTLRSTWRRMKFSENNQT